MRKDKNAIRSWSSTTAIIVMVEYSNYSIMEEKKHHSPILHTLIFHEDEGRCGCSGGGCCIGYPWSREDCWAPCFALALGCWSLAQWTQGCPVTCWGIRRMAFNENEEVYVGLLATCACVWAHSYVFRLPYTLLPVLAVKTLLSISWGGDLSWR